MTREEFITALEIAFERLMSPSRGLTPAQMEQPMAPDRWSFKGFAAHLSQWGTLHVRALEALHQGHAFDWSAYKELDRLNAEAVERAMPQTLKHVLYESRVTHSTLTEVLRRVPDERLLEGGGIPAWLHAGLLEHYEHHIPEIEAWAARLKADAKAAP